MLQTNRIILRPWRDDDAEALFRLIPPGIFLNV